VERLDISVQHEAQVRQLLVCQTGVLASAPFEPGVFADRAAVEQMPATSCRTESILPKHLAQADLVIVEVSLCAMTVENEGVIWYHVVRPFSFVGLKQSGQHTWPGVLPFHC